MQEAPKLTQDQCKAALDDAIEAFKVEENKQKILNILAEVAKLPPDQQIMARMMKDALMRTLQVWNQNYQTHVKHQNQMSALTQTALMQLKIIIFTNFLLLLAKQFC